MIYRAIQLIQIFCAHGRTNGLTKVIQEVLADLKRVHFSEEQNIEEPYRCASYIKDT